MARTKRRQWSVDEVTEALNVASDPQIAAIYQRRNTEATVLGTRFADMYALIKQIEPDAELSAELWKNPAFETRYMALRVLPKGSLTEQKVDAWVQDLDSPLLSDEFAKAVYFTPWAKDRMLRWIDEDGDFVQRAGWALLYGYAAAESESYSEDEWIAWLDRIERTIQGAPNWSRESMNNLPIAIGLRSATLKTAAIEAAERYGKISVYHGDKTNCKVNNPIELLNNPRTKVPAY